MVIICVLVDLNFPVAFVKDVVIECMKFFQLFQSTGIELSKISKKLRQWKIMLTDRKKCKQQICKKCEIEVRL